MAVIVECELVGGPGCGMKFSLPGKGDAKLAGPVRDQFSIALACDNKIIDPEGANRAAPVAAIAVYECTLPRNNRWLYVFKKLDRVG